MPAKPKRQLKPVREIDIEELKRDLKHRIREYEHRYEVSTKEMVRMVLSHERMDTDEIVKWLHAASRLDRIEELERSTAGSGSTATSKSTKAP
jgi:hypothetical protein